MDHNNPDYLSTEEKLIKKEINELEDKCCEYIVKLEECMKKIKFLKFRLENISADKNEVTTFDVSDVIEKYIKDEKYEPWFPTEKKEFKNEINPIYWSE